MSSSGIAGMYLKARTGSGSKLFYYKLPRYNGVVIDGYECVNELMASRLMDVLGALRALPRSSSRANQVFLRKRSVGSSAAAQTRRCRRLRSSRGRRGAKINLAIGWLRSVVDVSQAHRQTARGGEGPVTVISSASAHPVHLSHFLRPLLRYRYLPRSAHKRAERSRGDANERSSPCLKS